MNETRENRLSNFTVVGKEVRQLEGTEKVTGKSKYTCDLVLPGMLWVDPQEPGPPRKNKENRHPQGP